METNIFNTIISKLDLVYTACCILITYCSLAFVTKNPNVQLKHILSFLWGVALGLFWYFKFNTPIDTLILSFLVGIIGYDKLINPILKIFGITYNNDKGLI